MKAGSLVAAAIAVGLAVFYILVQQWPSIIAESTDIIFIMVSGGTSLYAFVVIGEMRKRTTSIPHLEAKLRSAYYGIFLAILLWFMGETTWGVYEVILRVNIPYPSIADIFYLAGYLPALASTLSLMWIFRRLVTPVRRALAGLVGFAIVGLVFVFVLGPLSGSSSDIVTKTFDLAYPFLDAVLLVLVTLILFGFLGSTLSKPWVWICASLLLNAFADIVFSWGTLTGWYYSGHPIELLWLYGYLGFAIGFNQQRLELSRVSERST